MASSLKLLLIARHHATRRKIQAMHTIHREKSRKEDSRVGKHAAGKTRLAKRGEFNVGAERRSLKYLFLFDRRIDNERGEYERASTDIDSRLPVSISSVKVDVAKRAMCRSRRESRRTQRPEDGDSKTNHERQKRTDREWNVNERHAQIGKSVERVRRKGSVFSSSIWTIDFSDEETEEGKRPAESLSRRKA